MKPLKLKTASFFVSAVLASTAVNAGPLQNQLDNVFNSMVNTTTPGAYESQRRGVLAGGSVYVRNKVVNTQIASLAPPSWKGGCGGIDFFGGSFSFINADQFVQLLRSVASNALGYAFQLALSSTCGECMATIGKLQDIIQKLNQYAGNSCQLAQGIVNDSWNAMGYAKNNKAMTDASLIGAFDDIFEATNNMGGGNDAQREVANSNKIPEEKKPYGNLVWRELKRNNTAQWYQVALGSSTQVHEMLMSLSGTIIVQKPEDTKDYDGQKNGSASKIDRLPPTMSMRDLVENPSARMYQCDNDSCMKPTMKTEQIDNIAQKFLDLMVQGNNSIVHKYATNSGSMTEQQKAFLSILPNTMGTLLRTMSLQNEVGAKKLAEDIAYVSAIDVTYTLCDEMLRSVEDSLSTSDMVEAKEMIDSLRDTRNRLSHDLNAIHQVRPTSYDTIIRDYSYLNQLIRKGQFMFQTAVVRK